MEESTQGAEQGAEQGVSHRTRSLQKVKATISQDKMFKRCLEIPNLTSNKLGFDDLQLNCNVISNFVVLQHEHTKPHTDLMSRTGFPVASA